MRIIRKAAVIGAVFTVFAVGPAYACFNTHNAAIFDFKFEPRNTQATDVTDTMEWTNSGHVSEGHTATSNLKGPGAGTHYFDTGVLMPNSSSSPFTLSNAGTFPYHCSIHTFMHGSVSVPVMVSARNGTTGTVFTVTWAGVAGVPMGFNADAQVKKPGSSKFVTFAKDQTTNSGPYTPTKPGIYEFRARLQNGTADASKYSPPVSIEVTNP